MHLLELSLARCLWNLKLVLGMTTTSQPPTMDPMEQASCGENRQAVTREGKMEDRVAKEREEEI